MVTDSQIFVLSTLSLTEMFTYASVFFELSTAERGLDI